MMAETVLRCSPEHRARSARDMGSFRRMKLSAIRRLICRAVSLVASWKFVRSILRMLGVGTRGLWRRELYDRPADLSTRPGYRFIPMPNWSPFLAGLSPSKTTSSSFSLPICRRASSSSATIIFLVRVSNTSPVDG